MLGPVIAEADYSGAKTWGLLGSAFGVGLIVGGLIAMRIRTSRPLVVSVLATLPLSLPSVGLALGLDVAPLLVAEVASGIGVAVHIALWHTVFQRQVPEETQARVSAFDHIGSFVMNPFGAAIAGPLAVAFGVGPVLLGAAVVMFVMDSAILAIRDVRRMT